MMGRRVDLNEVAGEVIQLTHSDLMTPEVSVTWDQGPLSSEPAAPHNP
jgi:hypothetical protein